MAVLLDKEIAKRREREEHDHRVRVVCAVVACRKIMQRQAEAAAAAESAARREARAPFDTHDRALAVRRMNKFSERQFKARYRVSRSTFDLILGRISPDLEPADRAKPGGAPNGVIPAQLKLDAATARRVAVDVPMRIRLRNRLKRLNIARPARGRLGSSNRR